MIGQSIDQIKIATVDALMAEVEEEEQIGVGFNLLMAKEEEEGVEVDINSEVVREAEGLGAEEGVSGVCTILITMAREAEVESKKEVEGKGVDIKVIMVREDGLFPETSQTSKTSFLTLKTVKEIKAVVEDIEVVGSQPFRTISEYITL
jgi:hypothetical protein